MNYLQPLLGGVMIGLASWLLLAGVGRIAGISSITAEAFTKGIRGADWRWAFLIGLVLGGAVFAQWLSTPVSQARSPLLLACAGLLVGVGTTLGAGCTSGHGVCGLGRRSLRSLVAVLVFMSTGFATVWVVKQFAA